MDIKEKSTYLSIGESAGTYSGIVYDFNKTKLNYVSIPSIKDLKGRNIILNLDNSKIKYKFLNGLKGSKRSILEGAKRDILEEEKYEFFLEKLYKNNYLLIYLKKEELESYRDLIKDNNVVISPEILGVYNYWRYLYKKKLKNAVIVFLDRDRTYLYYIRDNTLFKISTLEVKLINGSKDFSLLNEKQEKDDRKTNQKKERLKWLRELKYCLFNEFNPLKDFETYLLGDENIDELGEVMESYLEVKVNKTYEYSLDFCNMKFLGNLCAHKRIKYLQKNRVNNNKISKLALKNLKKVLTEKLTVFKSPLKYKKNDYISKYE